MNIKEIEGVKYVTYDEHQKMMLLAIKLERDACAKICEEHSEIHRNNKQFVYASSDDKCAYAIRNRGQK